MENFRGGNASGLRCRTTDGVRAVIMYTVSDNGFNVFVSDSNVFYWKSSLRYGTIAKWLRRQIRNLFPSGSAGSKSAGVDVDGLL